MHRGGSRRWALGVWKDKSKKSTDSMLSRDTRIVSMVLTISRLGYHTSEKRVLFSNQSSPLATPDKSPSPDWIQDKKSAHCGDIVPDLVGLVFPLLPEIPNDPARSAFCLGY